MPFLPGRSGNPTGKRPGKSGGGRTPDWLRRKCQQIIEKNRLLEFLADVANGKNFEQGMGTDGKVFMIPATVKDRLRATELLIERGYGKSPQEIKQVDDEGKSIPYSIVIKTVDGKST